MAEYISINVQRIEYLRDLFFGRTKQGQQDFLKRINRGLTKFFIEEKQIFSEQILLKHLKRVDGIFKKGLSFYTNPQNLTADATTSIFFRKDHFNSQVAFVDRERLHETESKIDSIRALSTLTNYTIAKKLPTLTNDNDPTEAARTIRAIFDKENNDSKIKKDRDFLQRLIEFLAKQNVFVFEFIETWNKIDKTNLNGFFISPNYITIKRQQDSLKREIFTLLHELGHCLLNDEEIDSIEFNPKPVSNKTERWCDQFAFSFLIDQRQHSLAKLFATNKSYNNSEMKKLSEDFHISRLALFTYLATNNKISWEKYSELKEKLMQHYAEKKQKQKRQQELAGTTKGGFAPQPIYSPLEKDVYAIAYLDGVISEYRVLSHFKTKNIDKLIYE